MTLNVVFSLANIVYSVALLYMFCGFATFPKAKTECHIFFDTSHRVKKFYRRITVVLFYLHHTSSPFRVILFQLHKQNKIQLRKYSAFTTWFNADIHAHCTTLFHHSWKATSTPPPAKQPLP